MVRNYKKQLGLGGRSYRQYSYENMKKALEAVKNGMSQKAAGERFKIPRITLLDKVHGNHLLKPGHPTVLTEEEEQLIAETLGTVSDWGYPMTNQDIAQVVCSFVTKQGRTIPNWTENMPGYDFVRSFAQRNNLTTRLATNIKTQRAAVGPPQIKEFFNNIEPHLKDAPPCSVYNYDETNITDDPGAKKVLVPRGRKRVERVQEHSRSSVSIMVCGTAEGVLLPPMVVYKSQNVYKNWTVGGPRGCEFACSKSGWFDMLLFEQWFFNILLPHIQNNSEPNGKNIVIGDNLASHFSPSVVKASLEHNIYMTPLPANSTHLMQPLDVSFFGPMKKKWRTVLDKWRKESRRRGTIPKEQFPGLLKQLWDSLLPTSVQNLKSGFRTTGLSPFQPEQILSKLPSDVSSCGSERLLDESLLDFFKKSRGYTTSTSPPIVRKRGKKMLIRPGQQMKLQTSGTSVPVNAINEEEQRPTTPINFDIAPLVGGSSTPHAPTASDDSDNEVLALKVKRKKGKTPKKVDSAHHSRRLQPSGASTSKGRLAQNYDSSNNCSICKCHYSTYTDSRDWITCISGLKWVCGICNDGSKDLNYECPDCNLCSICQCEYSCCYNQKAWIRCVSFNGWVCGLCNKGSKVPST